MYEKNMTGVMEFANGNAKVKILDILTYPSSGMPADFVFEYLEGEMNRPLVNPALNYSHGEGKFNIPEMMVPMVFKLDKEFLPKASQFEIKMEAYLKDNYDEKDIWEARNLFLKMVQLYDRKGEDGEKVVTEKYFNEQ